MPACTLKWRQKQLWVKSLEPNQACALASSQHEEWLIDCLKHSSARVVCLDSKLGAEGLRRWAEACETAGKPAFVRGAPHLRATYRRKMGIWGLEQALEWAIAALFLVMLSPLFLSLMICLWIDSPQPIFIQQWQIGKQGRLFRSIAFRTRTWNRQGDRMQSTRLRQWIGQSGLELLPQLINVVRGDLGLMDTLQRHGGMPIYKFAR